MNKLEAMVVLQKILTTIKGHNEQGAKGIVGDEEALEIAISELSLTYRDRQNHT